MQPIFLPLLQPICLPLRSVPVGVPYVDWAMADWQDDGWNKAMRECAHRLNTLGISVVLLEAVKSTTGDSQ